MDSVEPLRKQNKRYRALGVVRRWGGDEVVRGNLKSTNIPSREREECL